MRYRSTLLRIYGEVGRRKNNLFPKTFEKKNSEKKIGKKNHITQRLSRTRSAQPHVDLTVRYFIHRQPIGYSARSFLRATSQTGFHIFIHSNISPPPYCVRFRFLYFFLPSSRSVCIIILLLLYPVTGARFDDIFTAAFHDQTPSFFSSP